MDKKNAKRKVARVIAVQLRASRELVFRDNDGEGNPLSDADRTRMRDEYDKLVTFLEERSQGSATARW